MPRGASVSLVEGARSSTRASGETVVEAWHYLDQRAIRSDALFAVRALVEKAGEPSCIP